MIVTAEPPQIKTQRRVTPQYLPPTPPYQSCAAGENE
ncbi:hypothetical protein A2U01_0097805, partial [Trifolium medium]|nr:hypothetical protein [Trifolium medium]